MAVKKLTSSLLKKIILEEATKFKAAVDTTKKAKETEEVDADELADSLEKHIDYVKALKLEEARVEKRLASIREARQRAIKKLLSDV